MKIIKNNVKPKPTVQITCMFCTSILEVTADELTEYSHAFPPDFKEFGYGFNCPCCEQYSYVKDNRVLPPEFIENIKRYKSKFV